MLLDENTLAAQIGVFDQIDDSSIDARTPITTQRTRPKARTFGIPAAIWGSMGGCYTVFFGGLMIDTGHDGRALLMLAISILYTLMYFGTAYALNSLSAANRTRRMRQWGGDRFDTLSGPAKFAAVYGQILAVPIVFALFGLCIANVCLAGM